VEVFKAMLHPDDRIIVQNSEKLAAKTGHHNVIHRILRPDGTVRHVHELAQAETDSSGKLLRLTGTVQDITEQVAAEQALISARDEANRANRAKSEFLSSMSHELRTPMNAILGFSQLMDYDVTLQEEHRDSVQEILKAGYHLLELINEVLDLSKVESGNIDLSLEPVEVCQIVEECLSLVRTLANKRGISINLKGLQGVAVRADYTRLKQALLNLMSNAVKFTHQGGVVIRVEPSERGVKPGEAPLFIQVCVEDSGIGIKMEDQERIFEAFQQSDGSYTKKYEGAGLGLTIVRRFVELHGGKIWVSSRPGQGSKFYFTIPPARPPWAEKPEPRSGR